ncbi:hypothetical protein GLOIN_2v838603 [Rhizophagus irregularis DAOM 181602=DAOM 197198]|uniref:Uncharacterized protein n=1 Tax=Rhizophagus irregularis (strain DAOM 181602 / DAOM 197198 / MUCL 43194) TaxID=747089 RepID=A0A2P4QGY6_RHIID|nr:hypothetical protein GLOIN_2v838603 [Rhizophagus irregularis DAOM 181602=DAOM 197198]POG76919.1 hypothetical protein GLOIN_2v838603 [Rhizophagus irregularis DAOM 181602=DAOM 197198]GBC22206.2 hypothetical protein GLOIN_2v838603 [Rhizophagus irregularis DAOM 181602=DAOM 197198]|eukprot:XP_025183785.1 hypothetical protein GLOIN_2v838603 [Rhizophagus irregularis DAOM 181602=DAOM 197198]
MAYQRTILPLYYNPGLSPCSRTVWFLTGFLFGSLVVLAFGRPSLFYDFFNFLFTLFYLVLDFYKSETGQQIVIYIKKLYNNYSDFCSIRNLKELMERGDHMVPSLFIWIFQEYPESAGRFFRRFDLIVLNVIYKKISDYLLDCAADFLLPNWIFLKDWMRGMAKKVMIYVYTKFIISRIFSSRLPSIFRKHKLTPEDMV